jgi:hypothetical protein
MTTKGTAPGIKEKLAVARALIRDKHYDQALALLSTIDHPTARQWEKQIRERQTGSSRRTVLLLGAAAAILLVVSLALGAALLTQRASLSSEQSTAVAAVSTLSAAQTISAGFAATAQAGASTRAALQPDASRFDDTLAEGGATRTAEMSLNAATVTAGFVARPGGIDNPIPAGGNLDTESGTLRVLSVERPPSFVLIDSRTPGIARPAVGADFIGIELEFTCRPIVTLCAAAPEATVSLLADGVTIDADPNLVPRGGVLLGEQQVAGGATVRGWRFFQIPEGTHPTLIYIRSPLNPDGIFGLLPALVDGYAVNTDWEPLADGGRQRRLPAFRREMEARGFTLDEAYLRETPGQGTLLTLTLPASGTLADNRARLDYARAFTLAAAETWGGFRELAPSGLGISLFNYTSGEDHGGIAIAGSDLLAFGNGALDAAGFESRWLVTPP